MPEINNSNVVDFPSPLNHTVSESQHQGILRGFTGTISTIDGLSGLMRREDISHSDRVMMLDLLARSASLILQCNLMYIERVILE